MLFLRTHIENRNIFMLMLVTLLCISYLCTITILTHAAGPLVIFGVAITAKLVWDVVAAGGTAYTIYQLIKSQIKDLDEKIADLDKEVPKLFDRKNDLKALYEARLGFMKNWERRLAPAESALTAAEAATSAAETAKANAESVYNASARSRDTAKHAYMDHSCSTCYQYGTSYCSESIRLHNVWQGWRSQANKDYATYNTAKKTLKAKKKEERAAKSRVRKITDMKNHWEKRANSALSEFRKVNKKHKEKVADLEEKRIERSVRNAELEVSMGNVTGAKQELNDMQAQNPDAWTRVLDENPDLRQAVEEVLNYETD